MRTVPALLALLALGCTTLPAGDVPLGRADAGRMDAGRDASRDTGPGDSGPDDSGPDDSGPDDSGPDAGPDAEPCEPERYYRDCDGDGVGSGAPRESCVEPPLDELTSACVLDAAQWVGVDGDCNDFDGRDYPGARERCDGLDNDCDSRVDFDAEGDCPGEEVCVDGACRSGCPAGSEACATGGCTSTDSPWNCGSCGHHCRYGCVRSRCTGLYGLVAGGDRTCGWTNVGQVSCWGSAPFGAEPGATLEPRVVVNLPRGRVVDIAVGRAHQCVILENAGATSLYCWGENTSGETGGGDPIETRPVPMDTGDLTRLTDVAVGDGFSCVGTVSGEVMCWGRNVVTGATSGDRFMLTSEDQIFDLSAGLEFVCVHAADAGTASEVHCLGRDPAGGTFVDNPVANTALFTAGERHLCWFDTSASQILCRGDNTAGQIRASVPAPSFEAPEVAYTLPSGRSVERLEAGAEHTCAVIRESIAGPRTVVCWGANGEGQTGAELTTGPSAPTPLSLSSTAIPQSLALGRAHTCVLAGADRHCWGRSLEGQFGILDGAAPPAGGPEPELIRYTGD